MRHLIILLVANSCSRRHWCLIEPTTMLPPTVRLKTHALRFKCFDRRFSLQPRMTAMAVVVVFVQKLKSIEIIEKVGLWDVHDNLRPCARCWTRFPSSSFPCPVG